MPFRLIYEPAGGTRQEFDFDPEAVLNLEAEAIENVGGDSWDSWPEFLMKVGNGNTRAHRALLWTLLRRSQPELRFVDVVFNLNEFWVEEPDDEPESAGKDEPDDSTTDSPSPPPDSPAE